MAPRPLVGTEGALTAVIPRRQPVPRQEASTASIVTVIDGDSARETTQLLGSRRDLGELRGRNPGTARA